MKKNHHQMAVSENQTVEIIKGSVPWCGHFDFDEPTAVLTPQETENCAFSEI